MTMGKECDMSIGSPDHIQETIGSDPDVFGSFPGRASIGKNIPTRHPLLDLRSR
jgi:hypothetical protein